MAAADEQLEINHWNPMSSPAQSYLQVITNDNFIRDVLRKLFGIEGAGLVLAHLITPQPPPKKKKKR